MSITEKTITYNEAIERINHLEKLCSAKDRLINYYEDQEESLINTALNLAKENDIMTEQMFESPYAFKHEVKI